MATKSFEVMIRMPRGGTQVVVIQADGDYKARQLAELQYGKANVMSVRQLFNRQLGTGT